MKETKSLCAKISTEGKIVRKGRWQIIKKIWSTRYLREDASVLLIIRENNG